MKLLQLNAWMGKLSWAAERFIEQEKPDIICLQEVFQADVSIMIPDRMFHCLELFKQASGLGYCYFSPAIGVDIAGGNADFGNAILSRYPLQLTETMFTHSEYTQSFAPRTLEETARTIPRNIQIVEVITTNGLVTIVNHHGHWEPTPLGTEVSAAKMNLVADRVRQIKGALIMAGDLNVTPESKTMRVFDGWLHDLVAQSGAVTTLSKVGRPLDVVCDHILTNDHIEVKDLIVDKAVVSDHLPLVMDFELKK